MLTFFILLFTGAGGQFMADVYLPSLPAIQQAMGASTHAVQLTISVYVFGVAVAQITYGPLSDAFGRRKPLLFGFSLAVIGSLLCYLAPTIAWLWVGRFLQALGAGSGITLTRSILRDLYEGNDLARLASYFSIGSIAIMTSAPMVGALIEKYFGWHANFTCLLGFSLALLATVFFLLPETNRHLHPDYLKRQYLLQGIRTLLSSKLYIGYAMSIFLSFAAVFCWITISPILLITHLHVSTVAFGWIMLGVGMVITLTSFINAALLKHFAASKLVNMGLIFSITGGVMLLLLAHLQVWWGVVLPMYIVLGGVGFVFANSIACALNPFPKIAGMAGALISFWQILGGALASSGVASFALTSQWWLGILVFSLSLLALLIKVALV